eukprot:5031816-Heterocapsa_arctica.AAC.1
MTTPSPIQATPVTQATSFKISTNVRSNVLSNARQESRGWNHWSRTADHHCKCAEQRKLSFASGEAPPVRQSYYYL